LRIKFVVSIVISTLLVASIYSLSSAFDVFALDADESWANGGCGLMDPDTGKKTCCWREKIPGQILGIKYCQTCDSAGKNCDPKKKQITLPPTTADESVFSGEGVLEQLPTPPRGNDVNTPLDGGILEQQPSTSPQPSNQGGLLGLLDDKKQDNSQSFGDTNIQKDDDSNNDVLNSNDNTNAPQDDSGLLGLMKEGKEESSISETDDNNVNIPKESEDEEQEQEQQSQSQEQQEKEQEELSANGDETQSKESEDEEQEQEQEQPPIAETFNPNTGLLK
jgi:hypothetical protein